MTPTPRVTATPGRWQQLRDGLTETQARAAITAAAIVIGSAIAALTLGQTAVNLVLGGGMLVILWIAIAIGDQAENAAADADKARGDSADAKAQAALALDVAADCRAHHPRADETSGGRHSNPAHRPSPRARDTQPVTYEEAA